MKIRNVAGALLIALLLFVVACGQEQNDSSSSSDRSFTNAWDEALSERARLYEVLPDSTLAYVRVPNLWGMLAAPKSGSLAPALGSSANAETIAGLQARIPEVMTEEFGPAAPLLTLLLETLRSPLEVALVGEGSQPMEADIVIEGRFAFESVDELNALLTSVTNPGGMLQLLQPASEEQPGQILAGVFPVFYAFDPTSQRVRLVGGMAAQPESFGRSREWPENPESPMRTFHDRIDASGHGLFVWADMARLTPLMRQTLPADELEELETLGALSTDQVALGYGEVNGKAGLSLLASGSGGTLWDFTLPTIEALDFSTNGSPRAVVGLTVPDYAWLEALWLNLDDTGPEDIAKLDSKLTEEVGVGLREIVDTVAGRLFYVSDNNGGYLVHQSRNPDQWSALWDKLGERFDIRQTSAEHAGQVIHHVALPGINLDDQLDDGDTTGEQAGLFLVRKFMDIGTHFFWTGEGRNILISSVPQVLMDRQDNPGDTDVSDWLTAAGLAIEQAGLFAAMEIHDAPQRNYHTYLTTLLALGDMLDHPVDLMSFPTARELGLESTGTIGFGMDFSDGQIGATLTFENHPGDLFYGGIGGMGGIAVVGILAAIAVPAYQDYTVRAKVAAAMTETAMARLTIAEFYASSGRLPNAEETAELELGATGDKLVDLYYDSRTLRLVATLPADPALGEQPILELVPVLQSGTVTRWRCASTTIEEKHLPASCRP